MAYVYSSESLNNPIRIEHPGATLSELDLFSSLPMCSEIESSYWEKVYAPENALEPSQTDVIFDIRPAMDAISLADSYMELEVQLQKRTDDGHVNPGVTEKVNPSNR